MYGFERDDGDRNYRWLSSPLCRQFGVNEETKRPAENDTIDGMRERERERELFVVRARGGRRKLSTSRAFSQLPVQRLRTNLIGWHERVSAAHSGKRNIP